MHFFKISQDLQSNICGCHGHHKAQAHVISSFGRSYQFITMRMAITVYMNAKVFLQSLVKIMYLLKVKWMSGWKKGFSQGEKGGLL